MDKAQAIALLILLNSDTEHLNTVSEYIEQFEFTENNVRSILEQREES